MNCLDCATYETCDLRYPCDELEKELPGPQSGGWPGETIFMEEQALEYVVHHEGIDWDDLSPSKVLFNDSDINILDAYRFTDLQREVLRLRFYEDKTVNETSDIIGFKSEKLGSIMLQIKNKMVLTHMKWDAWKLLKRLDLAEEYKRVQGRYPYMDKGKRLRRISKMYFKGLMTYKEIAKHDNINVSNVERWIRIAKKILRKNGMKFGISIERKV